MAGHRHRNTRVLPDPQRAVRHLLADRVLDAVRRQPGVLAERPMPLDQQCRVLGPRRTRRAGDVRGGRSEREDAQDVDHVDAGLPTRTGPARGRRRRPSPADRSPPARRDRRRRRSGRGPRRPRRAWLTPRGSTARCASPCRRPARSCTVSHSSESYVRPSTTPEATDPMMLVSNGSAALKASVAARNAAAEAWRTIVISVTLLWLRNPRRSAGYLLEQALGRGVGLGDERQDPVARGEVERPVHAYGARERRGVARVPVNVIRARAPSASTVARMTEPRLPSVYEKRRRASYGRLARSAAGSSRSRRRRSS